MQRFFLPLNCFADGRIQFPSATSRQILQVLRMDPTCGQVAVIDPEGREFLVQLDGVVDGSLQGQILGPLEGKAEASLRLTLCFSLTKREKMELILQKCTEIGVATFQPYVSSRSLVQAEILEPKRLARWQEIIREACEQSHRRRLPEVLPLLRFEQLIRSGQKSRRLIAWEDAAESQLLQQEHLTPVASGLNLAIGPEGGFSEAEVKAATEAGWSPVSLGKTILRMETACITGSAIAIYLGELAGT